MRMKTIQHRSMDQELIEFLKSKAKWPATTCDTFRQTCGGKYANMRIEVTNKEERQQFCDLLEESTIWKSAINGELDDDARKLFEIMSTGKRLDCLTQVYPKTNFRFSFMTTSAPVELSRLIDSLPKEYGRFYLFQRNPITNLNEEHPVYQCYFSDCWLQNYESLQPVLKQIESLSGCKIDRRIYTNCVQIPGCFITSSSESFFKWIRIEAFDFTPPTPEDIILYNTQKSYSLDSSPSSPPSLSSSPNDPIDSHQPHKKQKIIHQSESESLSDYLMFVDGWVYHLITCDQKDEIHHWAGCLISRKELETLFVKRRPQFEFDFDRIEKHLCSRWEFVVTKFINQEELYYLIPSRKQLMSLLVFDTKRNLNLYKNNINKRDLTCDFSLQDGDVQCVFKEFERNLQSLFEKYEAFVGCVAWLNDSNILAMMKEKSLGLVVTKDPKNWQDDQLSRLLEQTTYSHYSVTSGVHPGTRFDLTKDDFEKAGQVRCIGDRTNTEDVILMHNKFLVFGEITKSESNFVFHPKCVWTGSRNMTFAAKRHRENAVIITNDKIASAYRAEWANLYLNSERLNNEQNKFIPTDYLVV